MGRSRSRSRSSSSSSDSEDSEERAEREAREAERREQRAYEKEQRRLAKQKKREAEKKADVEEAAHEKAGTLGWTFYIPLSENTTDEEPFALTVRATKPRFSHQSMVDTQSWEGETGLEPYLRKNFLAEGDDKTKVGLKGKVLLDGEPRLFFKNVCDMPTLANVHCLIVELGRLLLDAKEATVDVQIISMTVGKKLKGKAQPRTHKQDATEAAFKALKHAVYHEINEELLGPPPQPLATEERAQDMVARGHASDVQAAMAHLEAQDQAQAQRRAQFQAEHAADPELHYSLNGQQTGTWTAAASDLMRRDRVSLAKFHETRGLCEVVMGDADYHPNPCVLICPFAKCCKAHYHLNGFSAVSQLYSHWQKKYVCRRSNTGQQAARLLCNGCLLTHGVALSRFAGTPRTARRTHSLRAGGWPTTTRSRPISPRCSTRAARSSSATRRWSASAARVRATRRFASRRRARPTSSTAPAWRRASTSSGSRPRAPSKPHVRPRRRRRCAADTHCRDGEYE